MALGSKESKSTPIHGWALETASIEELQNEKWWRGFKKNESSVRFLLQYWVVGLDETNVSVGSMTVAPSE